MERARLFFRYRQLLEDNFDRICESVSREHGKTLAEARGSAYRGIENVEYACGIPNLLMGDTLENHRDSAWIGGCTRCQAELDAVCRRQDFAPRIGSSSDDMVVVQSMVAAGAGVAILPGLALRAHHNPNVRATEIAGCHRQYFAATYGEPPDPPAVAAVVAALEAVAANTA